MKTTLTAVLTCLIVSLLITLIVLALFGFSMDTPPRIFAFIWGIGFMSAWFSVFAITKTCKVLVIDDSTRVITADERSNKAGA